MTREQMAERAVMKLEAVERMRLWGMFPQTIKGFEKHDIISESDAPLYACYWLTSEELERVRNFENEYGGLVYHVIRSYTNFGEMESYLFVSKYREDWETERNYIAENMTFAYVYNKTMPDCSEMGTIGVKLSPCAGLMRTW